LNPTVLYPLCSYFHLSSWPVCQISIHHHCLPPAKPQTCLPWKQNCGEPEMCNPSWPLRIFLLRLLLSSWLSYLMFINSLVCWSDIAIFDNVFHRSLKYCLLPAVILTPPFWPTLSIHPSSCHLVFHPLPCRSSALFLFPTPLSHPRGKLHTLSRPPVLCPHSSDRITCQLLMQACRAKLLRGHSPCTNHLAFCNCFKDIHNDKLWMYSLSRVHSFERGVTPCGR
jgi:hypothetical protein